MIKQIVAMDKNYAIGNKNQLLFNVKEDLKHFKALTMGNNFLEEENHVVMGRKTYESLPKPLEKRINVVMSKNNFYFNTPTHDNLNSLLKRYKELKKGGKISSDMWIIGGAEIYKQSLPYADEIYVTHFNDEAPEADTYYPMKEMLELFEEDCNYLHHAIDQETGLAMKFARYKRK